MTLYRTMLKTDAGGPVTGTGKTMLGARPGVDVKPDRAGQVHPGRGGISVAPDDPARLPAHLRPVRLGGNSGLPVFAIDRPSIVRPLAYAPDARWPDQHGTIEPAESMQLPSYQEALAATAPAWREVP